MRALWIFALPVLLGAAAPGPCTPAFCSCREPPPPQDALERADAVFRGTVLSVRDTVVAAKPADGSGWPMRAVRFRVDSAWKGLSGETVTVLTGSGGGDCGFGFRTGGEYLVYAHEVRGRHLSGLSTGICSRTAPSSHAGEDLDALGAPAYTPAADPPAS